jgi:cyclopropane fatty-acyl-phospholipid synthase-like methyltransferase
MIDNSKSREYWESTAKKQKKLNRSFTHSNPYMPMLETNAIVSKISEDDTVLEIGCGACDNSIAYMRKSANYIGVEKIETFVDLSREKIKKITLAIALFC